MDNTYNVSKLGKIDLIKALKEFFILADNPRLIVKTIDYSNNPIAPERYCYKLFFTDYSGNRRKVSYFPKTVGFQNLA